MNDNPSPTVTRNAEANRYEIYVDDALAGVVEYEETEGRIALTHTEVFDEFRGGGTASTLAGGAIVDAIARGLIIVPVCPFIARYLDRHPAHAAHVEAPRA